MGLLSALLVTGADGRWYPGIGDPSVMGWVTVLAYFATAFYCFRARAAGVLGAESLAKVAPLEAENQRVLARFWFAVFVLMAFLGLNKQLDLQTFFTQTMRDLSLRDGWYERRRPLQVGFVIAVGVIGVVGTIVSGFLLRHVFRRIGLALAGVMLIVVFVVVRAASFHHVDVLLGSGGAFRLNWVLELSALSVLFAAAYRAAAPLRGATG